MLRAFGLRPSQAEPAPTFAHCPASVASL